MYKNKFRYLESSETDYNVTSCHIPEERKPQLRRCEELKTLKLQRRYITPIRRTLLQHNL